MKYSNPTKEHWDKLTYSKNLDDNVVAAEFSPHPDHHEHLMNHSRITNEYLAQNPHVGKHVLNNLMNDSIPWVRRMVAFHTPYKEHLEILQHDSEEMMVSGIAQYRLKNRNYSK